MFLNCLAYDWTVNDELRVPDPKGMLLDVSG